MIGQPEHVPGGVAADGTLVVPGDRKSSKAVLSALTQAEKAFRTYDDFCFQIDRIYSAKAEILSAVGALGFTDQQYDLFWSSIEILKPAIYAKPPNVVAKPRFSDANATVKAASDVIERVVNSEFEQSDIDQVLLGVRDDLALINRGVAWVRYESDDDGKRVCIEDLDRKDFLHEPARKWREVGWVARAGWLTRQEMADRFRKASGDAYQRADYRIREGARDSGSEDGTLKAQVWEVWHKADKRVYWVTENVDVMLDEGEPHLNLKKFFPCPRPAYGTLQRRTLIPVPDYLRYANHLDQINLLTVRIYDLLEQVKIRGLIPAGGDVGSAIETAINENDSAMFIPVPSAALLASGGSGNFVQFLPLAEIAQAIQGLIDARNQLFNDFYQLSGISDIMRGATEAEETLGAQRLKSQYGSIRVKDKIDEIVRLSRDCAQIATEIICDNFSEDDLLEIAQMTFPTKREVDKSIKDIQKAAKDELEQLADTAQDTAQRSMEEGKQVDQAQVEQQFAQSQRQIIEKYAPQLQQLQNAVTREDVMKAIRDDKARALAIDIETDSTVMVDEMMEKQTRSEFLGAFSTAVANMQPVIAMGEAGAKLAGAMIKFTLQPYHVDRQLEAQIDDFVRQAPEMAAQMAAQQGEGSELAEAQNKLAEAEQMKAQAAMANVQARAALSQADNQRKFAELQQRAQNDAEKSRQENDKLRLELAQMQEDRRKTDAEIDKLRAETAKILAGMGIDARKQNLDEFKAVADTQMRADDQSMRAVESERANARSDRAQDMTEREIQ